MNAWIGLWYNNWFPGGPADPVIPGLFEGFAEHAFMCLSVYQSGSDSYYTDGEGGYTMLDCTVLYGLWGTQFNFWTYQGGLGAHLNFLQYTLIKGRQADCQTDSLIVVQLDNQTDRQADIHTDRQTCTAIRAEKTKLPTNR